jgi:hypothetical protein
LGGQVSEDEDEDEETVWRRRLSEARRRLQALRS